MGVLVWQGGLGGPPRVLLGFAVLPSPFMATTDSSYQNTYEYLAILLGLLLETEYVPSKLNIVCDGLSRDIPPSELGLDESLWVQLPETGPVVQYIRECDPRLPLITWTQVTDHMGLCHQLLTRI